jgi:hypothetical protein
LGGKPSAKGDIPPRIDATKALCDKGFRAIADAWHAMIDDDLHR